jgi:hypothetical protein
MRSRSAGVEVRCPTRSGVEQVTFSSAWSLRSTRTSFELASALHGDVGAGVQ